MGRESLYFFRRDAILEAIERMTINGKAPSMREIGDVTGIALASLHKYLETMREEGVVEWTYSRTLRLTGTNAQQRTGTTF